VGKFVEFDMHRQKPVPVHTPYARPWLAASGGRRLPRNDEVIAPADAPESILEVEFEGLTEAEQRAALAGFPGGRRFRLASSRH
jgi:hypothetical protein